jgi:DNA-binding MarR family transcriptional regulator
MAEKDIPKEVKDFVFHSIDSAEQLDILLLLHGEKSKSFSVRELSDFLRSSPNSVEKRLQTLIVQGLTQTLAGDPLRYQFYFSNEAALKLVSELAEVYKVHRYGILEIIFSPLKRSRDFAEAFKISGTKDPKGGHGG